MDECGLDLLQSSLMLVSHLIIHKMIYDTSIENNLNYKNSWMLNLFLTVDIVLI